MNRKSFYYHFRDKYDLVNWIFYVDFIERMEWSSCRNEWDMLEALCSHFYRERLFYQNALQVEGQNSFREYFCGNAVSSGFDAPDTESGGRGAEKGVLYCFSVRGRFGRTGLLAARGQ